MKARDPNTPEEWQEAYDAALACRTIADCRMYGLLKGGPLIDLERCDRLIAAGEKRGLRPSRPVEQLAIGLVDALNADAVEARDTATQAVGAALNKTALRKVTSRGRRWPQ
jgi:hypothetical protein